MTFTAPEKAKTSTLSPTTLRALGALVLIPSLTAAATAPLAQPEWITTAKTTGSAYASSLATNSLGSLYWVGGGPRQVTIGGMTLPVPANGNQFYNGWIVKLDRNGKVLLSKLLTSPTNHCGIYAVQIAPDGTVLITGSFNGNATLGETRLIGNSSWSSLFVARLDANLNVIWTTTVLGSDQVNVEGDGFASNGVRIAVSGYWSGTARFGDQSLTSQGSPYNAFVAVFDMQGRMQWVRTAVGPQRAYGMSARFDALGNVVTGGYFQGVKTLSSATPSSAAVLTSRGGYDGFVAKYSGDTGTLTALTQIGGPGDEQVMAAVPSGEDTFVAGNNTAAFNAASYRIAAGGPSQCFVLRLNSAYQVMAATSYGGDDYDQVRTLVIDPDGRPTTCGIFSGTAQFGSTSAQSAGNYDAYVVRFNRDLTVSGVTTWGGANVDSSGRIVVDDHYRTYVTGHFIASTTLGQTTITSLGDPGNYNAYVAVLKEY